MERPARPGIAAAFAASLRLPHAASLLVDTGSPNSIVGSEWIEYHQKEVARAGLPGPRYAQRERPLSCSGVGTGSLQATHDVEVPIGLGNGRLDGFRGPELPNSSAPALAPRDLAAFIHACQINIALHDVIELALAIWNIYR